MLVMASAVLILAACADSRPVAAPAPVSISLQITLNKWSWILECGDPRHAAGEAGVARAVTPPPADHPIAAQPVHDDHAVMVEVGFGETIYASSPLDRFAAKAPILAGSGVRNWIRIRDGERMIVVGSVAGKEDAGITIELGPGISMSEY